MTSLFMVAGRKSENQNKSLTQLSGCDIIADEVTIFENMSLVNRFSSPLRDEKFSFKPWIMDEDRSNQPDSVL